MFIAFAKRRHGWRRLANAINIVCFLVIK